MKLAFIVCNDLLAADLLKMLRACEIDYYTCWGNAKGKGHGTEPHLGTGSFGSRNMVLMIAFENPAALDALIEKITAFNSAVRRRDDCMRLFQVPLERIV